MDEFPAMTDQEAIRTLLMLPWAIGDNTEDGQVSYSANEIKDVLRFVNSLCDRVEAAEAETEQLRFQRDGWMRVSDAARHEVLLQRRIVDSLQAELSVCRDLLRSVPEHSEAWYADICDYLETC